ncbi:MAG: PP2C family protein-serine/threonine phosphatase [Thermoanaerobaculia bacterium]
MADPQPTDELEQTAHMIDAEAVRRVFDASNAAWTAAWAAIFTLVNLGLMLWSVATKQAPPMTWFFAGVGMIISASAAWLANEIAGAKVDRGGQPRRRVTRYVARNTTDWIFVYFLTQFAVFSYSGGVNAAMVWGSIFPWLLLGLRMSLIRRIALHAGLFAVTLAFLFAHNGNVRLKNGAALGVTYTIVILIGALNSRRVRRKTIEEWSERRTSAREQVRMRDELRYAREVQLSMLPEAPPALDWAEVAGTSIPATEVGGDYFDYIDADGRLAVVSGDVAGHGLASGITLSALRGAITLLRHSFSNPAGVLEQLHDVITEVSRRRTLVTFNAALFDPQRRRATIASAGHPPVLVRRASGHVDTIELFGPPLGVRRSGPIPQREIEFASGDVFLLHSDGIYETTNTTGEQYGLDRLAQSLAKSDGSAAAMRDAVLRDVDEFRGGAPQQDDVTVVVVRIT